MPTPQKNSDNTPPITPRSQKKWTLMRTQSMHERVTQEDLERSTYGRRLNDTKGARKPLCCFFSYGFYDASKEPGTNFLESIAITSSLATTDDTEAENDNCKAFLKRYYAKHRIFDTQKTAEALTNELENLLDQLYYDITYRRFRKTSGDNQIHWINTFLATSVSIIAFARNIIPNQNQNDHADTHAIINYFEGGTALGALIFTKIKNTSTQEDVLATQALEKIRKWIKKDVTDRAVEKQRLFPDGSHHDASLSLFSAANARMKHRLPIEDQLHNQRYIVQPSNNLHYNLLDAVTTLRSIAGHPTSISQLDKALKSKMKPSAVDLEANNHNTPEMIEAISRLYDCPIFIVQEKRCANETYCQLINEKTPTDEETKEDIDTHQKTREKNALILYSSESGYYQAVIPRDLKEKRTFETIKAELMALTEDESLSAAASPLHEREHRHEL